MKPLNGSKLINGCNVPVNATIAEYQGRECYLSGIDGDYKIIRFLDTGEVRRVKAVF